MLLDGLNCIPFEVCVELDLLSSQHNFWCSPRKIITQMYKLIVLFTLHVSQAELVSFALQEVNCVCYHPSVDALARKNSFNLDFFQSFLSKQLQNYSGVEG